ncbi:hypothetical protein [Allorhodopirellula solitaria]|uniref:Lipoprotein n=1 Tax=Allorhodopirellula solitaria TaxID=2527987 RepID=A0A5C5YBP9_9BACT|nr:hypothetical protein [Allorhodopirellula solitaria]TWT73126.1 hypothetical protein CA85_15930 [Allorhodopirellula solitaria]
MKMTILATALMGGFALVAGCMPSTPTAENGESTTPGVTAEEATPRETVGKTTQNVLDLESALGDGGVLASTKVEASNPLMASADAYRTTVGKLGGMSVDKAIQLRNAQSIQDPRPLDHETFMAEIIKADKPNGIRLPMLPYYQEYAWDEPNQKLVVVDFPARQAEREKQR